MDTNLYWMLRGTFDERKKKLEEADPAWLRACILDGEYNNFLADRADFDKDEEDPRGHGKRLPYIGWYWRHLQFSDGHLPIGDCGDFIGFIANNKWGHPQRDTTPEEFARIMELIDAAMLENQEGGSLDEIVKKTHAKLDELWDYLQTLEVD
jgi:hypothetical protein